jgi:hypothetical protein
MWLFRLSELASDVVPPVSCRLCARARLAKVLYYLRAMPTLPQRHVYSGAYGAAIGIAACALPESELKYFDSCAAFWIERRWICFCGTSDMYSSPCRYAEGHPFCGEAW